MQATSLKLVPLKHVGKCIVALYLIGAASLKVFGPGQEIKLFSPLVIFFATLVEFFVGALLLTNIAKNFSWILGISLFISLDLISANTAISGISDCGCFGPLNINPWVTTCFNTMAIFLLLLARPIFSPGGLLPKTFIVFGLSMAGLGFSFLASGANGDHIMAYLQNDLVYLAPSFVNLGVANPGEKKMLRFQVLNRSPQPVKVIGGNVVCNCMVVNNLPLLIPANGSVEIGINIEINNQEYAFTGFSAKRV